ncbi:Nucleotide-binding universal stress protein, UspA family [Desulfacinum hydrothermale DSM 13146]|uniref:Nucleotide-binding universal stress protein, UspA family n=1 Tax=Desulfacinum hydrothermale DSM 13146 TaxID=1121390 RepID=A0A1W1X4J1_9BACT|nr:universal stress protein [Desulfacinum hydrothermale]SMC18815.1 Nucleotide-binding universal stress protein, UspA family [Desulfacinum hydrothermale DSM 13146]
MERILVALDDRPGSLKTIHYINRVLRGAGHVRILLFHVLPAISQNLLSKEETRRMEDLQEERPHLSGYFWQPEAEKHMREMFHKARDLLVSGGFADEQIEEHFAVESQEVASVIVSRAETLQCSTIAMGRRGLSRVKELFLGSVSKSVTGRAKGRTVWVVDSEEV